MPVGLEVQRLQQPLFEGAIKCRLELRHPGNSAADLRQVAGTERDTVYCNTAAAVGDKPED